MGVQTHKTFCPFSAMPIGAMEVDVADGKVIERCAANPDDPKGLWRLYPA